MSLVEQLYQSIGIRDHIDLVELEAGYRPLFVRQEPRFVLRRPADPDHASVRPLREQPFDDVASGERVAAENKKGLQC